jgi:hypothetical protein
MMSSWLRGALLAMLGCTAACGALFDEPLADLPDARRPADARPGDARVGDAMPDGRPDARPDAQLPFDADHDGHPAGDDCDDHDPSVWQDLAYSFRDVDGDGHTVAQAGTICAGGSLPPDYLITAGPPDCNDGDPAVFTSVTGFVDVDGDGVGDGVAMTLCTRGNLPAGFVATGGDCTVQGNRQRQ